MRKIVVVVEDVEAARTAFEWALHNLLRYGDLITLLHVFPKRSRSKKKLRLSRLKGFQLALSFKDICSDFPNYYYRQRSRLLSQKATMKAIGSLPWYERSVLQRWSWGSMTRAFFTSWQWPTTT